MERMTHYFEPEVEPEFDASFDRAEIEEAAAQTAHIMLADCIDPALRAEHRFEIIAALIEELGEDKGNHFIVKALEGRLSYEKALLELQMNDEQFLLTV
jgi:hypothetical protein